LIRTIRNEFAHRQLPLRFDIPEAKAVCDHLQIPDTEAKVIPPYLIDMAVDIGLAEETPDHWSDRQHPKTRFVICATEARSEAELLLRGWTTRWRGWRRWYPHWWRNRAYRQRRHCLNSGRRRYRCHCAGPGPSLSGLRRFGRIVAGQAGAGNHAQVAHLGGGDALIGCAERIDSTAAIGRADHGIDGAVSGCNRMGVASRRRDGGQLDRHR
jgi:hypothetical protein